MQDRRVIVGAMHASPTIRRRFMPEELTQETNNVATAEEPTIEIVIDRKGNISLETIGTKGNQCDLLAGELETNIGKVSSRKNKETYNNG
jgi:hypothetical protein